MANPKRFIVNYYRIIFVIPHAVLFLQIIYVAIVIVTISLSWKAYAKYVAGIKNPVINLKNKVFIVTGSNTGSNLLIFSMINRNIAR